MVGHDAGRSLGMREGPRHEVKFTSLDLKAVDVDGSFEGYASLFNKDGEVAFEIALESAGELSFTAG